MQDSWLWITGFLAGGLAFVALSVFAVAAVARAGARCWQNVGVVAGRVRWRRCWRCAGVAKDDGTDDGTDDALRRESRRWLVQQKLALARLIIKGLGLAGCLRFPGVVLGALADEAPIVKLPAFLGYIASLVLCAVGTCRPGTVNERNLNLWHIAMMVPFCCGLAPFGADATVAIVLFRPAYMLASFCIGFMGVNTWVTVLTNLVFHASSVSVSFGVPAEIVGRISVGQLLLFELIGLVTKIALLLGFGVFLERAASSESQAKLGLCHRSAVASLLAMICDGVVEVDSDLKVQGDAASLRSLLMHGAGGASHGASLPAYMVDGDEFLANIRRNTGGPDREPSAGAFSGVMRDSVGNRIRFVFYHVPFRGLSGAMCHLIGLREADAVAEEQPMQREMPSAILDDGVAGRVQDGCFVGRTRALRLGRDRRSGSGSSSGSSAGPTGPDEAAVIADVIVGEGLAIDATSAAFRQAFKLSTGWCGRPLAEVIPPSVAGGLQEFILPHAELILSGAAPAPAAQALGAADLGGCIGQRRIVVLFPAPEAGKPYRASIDFREPRARQRRPELSQGSPAHISAQGLRRHLQQL